ncbi:MAG: hypothetical protein KGR17_09575 [Acidobacteria bacterium]|nr:hypothetical protein [Acidobacteriota bacterium]
MSVERPERLAALRELIEQVQPVVGAHERTLEVDPPVRELLPLGALQRGTTVWVGGGAGATSLAMAVVAGPSRCGSWVGCVSVSSLGWAAAAELGVDLSRVAVVRADGPDWATVAATLVDGFDVVLCGPDHRPGRREVARLAARARERGAVVVALDDAPDARAWPGVDLRLHVDARTSGRWDGAGRGWGALRSRAITVVASGRHGVDRSRRVELLLPGPAGIAASAPAGGAGSGIEVASPVPVGPDRVVPFRVRSA